MVTLEQAYQEWRRRQRRLPRIPGRYEHTGDDRRWTPAPSELRQCCARIGEKGLYQHCKTLLHVAYVAGVDLGELQAYARSKKAETRLARREEWKRAAPQSELYPDPASRRQQ